MEATEYLDNNSKEKPTSMMVVRYFLGMALQQEATTDQQNDQPTSKPTNLMFVQDHPRHQRNKPANQQMNKQASKQTNKQTNKSNHANKRTQPPQQIIN